MVLLFLAIAGGYSVSRLLSRIDSAIAPGLVVLAGVAVIVVGPVGEIYTDAPRVGPFGYSSITGAYFLQCAFGASLLVLDRRTPLRVIGLVATAAFIAVPFVTQTRAAIATIAIVPIAFVVKHFVGTRAAISTSAVVFALALVGSVVLAATYSGADAYADGGHEGIDAVIDATISLRRVEFQHDALRLMGENPVTGIGPGRFDEVSEAVARDPDEPWAHNDFLQHGAESGVLGMAIVVAIVGWAFYRLRTSIARRRRSVLVAAAVGALGVHACVEYVLQFPAIPALTAALLGCAVELHPRFGRPALAEAP